MATSSTQGVRTQHPDYARLLPLWERCEDAAEGEHAIHSGGIKYLPALIAEKTAAYDARKNRSPFFNATWRTISGLKGMLFRKKPESKIPAAIEMSLFDIDMAGTPMEMFAQQVAEEALTVGRCGILIDRPFMPENIDGTPLTVAQVESLGLRPMMLKYPAKSIINWKTDRIGNVMKTTLIVLKESASIPANEFDQSSEDRYRVLDLTFDGYRQRVYRIDEQNNDQQVGGDIYPQMNGRNMSMIPFIFVNVDSLNATPESPPLLDLVDMNIHHYQVGSDWEHGCHFSGLPTLFVSGYNGSDDDKPIYIGGPAANALPDPNAKAYYVEVQNDFRALQSNLEQKKAEMAVLGARMLENSKAGVESADTLQTRSQGEQSQLAAFAQVLSMAFTKALNIFSEWSGASGEVEYSINRDFVPVGMPAQELTALVTAWQSGMPGASGQNVYALMQRKEMADPLISYEEEQERIGSKGMMGMDAEFAQIESSGDESLNTDQMDISALVAAITNMPAPIVNVAAPIINVPAAIINMPEQQAPTITVNTPDIVIHPAAITVNSIEGSKAIELQYDSEGNITGGSVSPAGK